jgi:hypothetical protein
MTVIGAKAPTSAPTGFIADAFFRSRGEGGAHQSEAENGYGGLARDLVRDLVCGHDEAPPERECGAGSLSILAGGAGGARGAGGNKYRLCGQVLTIR